MAQDLANLVGSRICHDLISPIGAIGNGLELLSLTQKSMNEEMDLVSESAQSASARVQFFRIAYGGAAADQTNSSSEIVALLKACDSANRYSYDWQTAATLARQDIRIACLVIQCLETAAPTGGTMFVKQRENNWSISVDSRDPIRIEPQLWATLQMETFNYEFASSQVQFALLPNALREAGRTLSFSQNGRFNVQF